LSEYQFAGLLRGSRTELVKCIGNDLQVPARAEIVLEGVIHPNETALEGPYGDHTGYYNEQDHFPVFTVERITMRENPIYHSTYTGKPPVERSVRTAFAKAVPRNHRFLPAARRLFLPHGGGQHEKTVRRTRQARDDGLLVVSAPVYVHQIHHRGG